MLKQKFLYSLFILLFVSSLQAEIEQISFTWRAAECQAGCDTLLKKELGKIYGVSEVQVDLAAGQATLKWKPNVAFSFYPINTAIRMVGPHMRNLRAKVRGKIKHDTNNVKLISEGDSTEFYLINPVIPVANQYVETHSVFNRSLTPDLKKQLIDSEAKKQIVTIEGPIFEPYRSPPLQLVVENLSFEDQTPKK